MVVSLKANAMGTELLFVPTKHDTGETGRRIYITEKDQLSFGMDRDTMVILLTEKCMEKEHSNISEKEQSVNVRIRIVVIVRIIPWPGDQRFLFADTKVTSSMACVRAKEFWRYWVRMEICLPCIKAVGDEAN